MLVKESEMIECRSFIVFLILLDFGTKGEYILFACLFVKGIIKSMFYALFVCGHYFVKYAGLCKSAFFTYSLGKISFFCPLHVSYMFCFKFNNYCFYSRCQNLYTFVLAYLETVCKNRCCIIKIRS